MIKKNSNMKNVERCRLNTCKGWVCLLLSLLVWPLYGQISDNGDGTFRNPVIYADVPDPDVVRVGENYYMVSTTMHMSPGCPIMKSKDLVNWTLLGYAHDQLEETDDFALKNGRNVYANGSWAANLRYDRYEGMFYLIVTCNTTRKSYIFTTPDIEKGHWHRNEVDLCYDPGLLFEDTGTECRKYIVHPDFDLGKHEVFLRELVSDGKGNVTVTPAKVIIPYGNLENPAQGLRAEGAHGYKVGDYYYIFMIQGVGGQRQEIVWRSKTLEPGSFEGRLVFAGNIVDEDGKDYMPFTGVAQGGIVDTPDGKWYALLFQDYGAVGRIPVLIPMEWDEDGWPVLGNDGKSVNRVNEKPVQGAALSHGIVVSDEFDNGDERYVVSDKYASSEVTAGLTVERMRELIDLGALTDERVSQNEYGYNGSNLKVEWQWNHNPNNNLWSLTERDGFLRLKAGLLSPNIRSARNTLTQRTFGPTCSAETVVEVGHMNDGDCAGLTSWQCQYGFVGVKQEGGRQFVVMQRAMKAGDAEGRVMASIPLAQEKVWLKVDCDFRDRTDKAYFYYSLDGSTWYRLGDSLQMAFDWPDFVGQRFGLFYYATKLRGGYVDFDYFMSVRT